MIHPTLRPLAWAPLLLALVVAAGCERANYEKRMDARLVEFRHLAKFRSLNEIPSELLPGTTELTIRLPIRVGTQMTLETKDNNDSSKPMDPRRVQPPFLPLPGFISCYEQMLRDVKGNQLTYTMYVAAQKLLPLPEGAEKRDPLEDTLLKQLKAALPELLEGTLQWKSVTCSSPEPTSSPKPGVPPVFATVPWRSIEVECEQEFFGITEGGNREFFKLPGLLKLFLYEYKEKEETRYFVLLGWRAPKVLLEEKRIPADEMMDYQMNLIGGTIKVNPPPAQ